METDSFKIEKLRDASNFSTWKFQIKLTLAASEVIEIVDGTTVKPEDNFGNWEKMDVRARRIIGTTVCANVITHIKNCKTSKEMFDKLCSVYEQKNETSILMLNQKFFTIMKEASENMVSYIARVEELVHQLKEMDQEISDEMVIAKIIMALPEDYNAFSSAWESTAKADINLDNLRARLIMGEN